MVGVVLRWPAGRWLVAAAGAVVVIAGLYQLLYVYEGDHKRQLRLRGRRLRGRGCLHLRLRRHLTRLALHIDAAAEVRAFGNRHAR